MREGLELETLEERRLSLHLILMYKVVEGLAPALPTDNFVKLDRPKRNIKTKHFKDHITSNIVEKGTCNNTKGLELPDYKKQQYQHSFFVDIVIHWNHLPNSVVHAHSLGRSNELVPIKTAVGALSTRCIKTIVGFYNVPDTDMCSLLPLSVCFENENYMWKFPV